MDYSLKRRATLVQYFKGATAASDICDADPYLKLAAKFHGEAIERPCPVCREPKLVLLHYAFGDQLGQYSGRIKTDDELDEMESEFGEFRVYTVEVCRNCSWNHLCHSYLLGDGRDRKPPRRKPTLEDQDWVKG